MLAAHPRLPSLPHRSRVTIPCIFVIGYAVFNFYFLVLGGACVACALLCVLAAYGSQKLVKEVMTNPALVELEKHEETARNLEKSNTKLAAWIVAVLLVIILAVGGAFIGPLNDIATLRSTQATACRANLPSSTKGHQVNRSAKTD